MSVPLCHVSVYGGDAAVAFVNPAELRRRGVPDICCCPAQRYSLGSVRATEHPPTKDLLRATGASSTATASVGMPSWVGACMKRRRVFVLPHSCGNLKARHSDPCGAASHPLRCPMTMLPVLLACTWWSHGVTASALRPPDWSHSRVWLMDSPVPASPGCPGCKDSIHEHAVPVPSDSPVCVRRRLMCAAV